MKIEIWSDVACPWCYIGKRHFESALEKFAHHDEVDIVWRSFQLDPTLPTVSEETHTEHLQRKFGRSAAQVAEMNRQMQERANAVGLDYHFDEIKSANTFTAHRLIHFAAAHGLQGEMKERLMKAYWSEGLKLWDTDSLVQIATEIGLDADEARATLESEAYADDVRADFRRAGMFGIQGVPFFAIDEKYGVSGAQPVEVFSQVLEQAWADSHPLIKVVGGSDAGMCEDGSCAI
jgi:predicted DsbA family dithiol-disulfide isomerase